MSGFSIPGLGGFAAVESVLKTQANDPEVKTFMEKAQESYNRDNEFKAEINRIIGSDTDVVDVVSSKDDPAFDGLTDSERELVLASMRRADDSSVQLSEASQNKSTTKTVLTILAIAAAALIAMYVFRGIVFRTLYALAVRMPFFGPILKSKYGEPKELISGKISDETLGTLISNISALERLTGIKGYTGDEPNLVKFLRLVRELPVPDVERIYRDAKDFKRLR